MSISQDPTANLRSLYNQYSSLIEKRAGHEELKALDKRSASIFLQIVNGESQDIESIKKMIMSTKEEGFFGGDLAELNDIKDKIEKLASGLIIPSQDDAARRATTNWEKRAKFFMEIGVDSTITDETEASLFSKSFLSESKDIINKGINYDINSSDEYGKTALHYAVERNDKKFIQLLIDKKANVNIPDDEGITPFFSAYKKGLDDIAELFINEGSALNSRDNNGNTALHQALESGDIEFAKFLLNNKIDVTVFNNNGETLLHIAIKTGLYEVLEKILESPRTQEIIDKTNIDGDTALNLAVKIDEDASDEERASALKCVELLIKHKANITIPNLDKEATLHIASACGFHAALEKLLELPEGIEVIDALDKDGNTALLTALNEGNIECAKLLIQKGADITIANYDGEIPFHTAIQNGLLDIVTEMLAKGIDPNVCDKAGNSPLYYSIVGKDDLCTNALFVNNATITDKPNESGNSIFSELLRHGDSLLNQRLIKQFLKQNKDIDLTRHDGFGNTPLHYACTHEISALFNDLIVKLKPKDLLEKNIYYETPLQLAFDKKHWIKPSKDNQVFLQFILKGCLKRHRNEITKAIKENGINGLSKYLHEHVEELLKDAKDVNPLVIALLLNDNLLAHKMKSILAKDTFNKYISEIYEDFKPMANDFCKFQNFFYKLNPSHLQKGLLELPEENAEGAVLKDLLKMFDELYELNHESITPKIFEDEPRESLRKVLEDFIDKVINRTQYLGTPDDDAELERFYKTIEIAQTHVIKKLQSLEGDAGRKRQAEIIKNLIEEVHLCGGKIHSISVDLYNEVCQGESPSFEAGVYKSLSDLRRVRFVAQVPRDPQSVHDKNTLMEKIGKLCGISGSKSEFSDVYSGAGVNIARAKKGFFNRYNSYEVADCVRDNLREVYFYELFEKWIKENKFDIIPNYFQESCKEIFKNPKVTWMPTPDLIPTNFQSDLLKISAYLGYEEDDFTDAEVQEMVLKNYFKPETWMMVDFAKILKDGDSAFKDITPELQAIIKECGMEKRLDTLFKGKSLENPETRKEVVKVKLTLFKNFCEKYGGPFLSNSQMVEVLKKLDVIQDFQPDSEEMIDLPSLEESD